MVPAEQACAFGAYKLPDVLQALRKTWGGESLVAKDQERHSHGKGKAYIALDDGNEDAETDPVWYEETDQNQESVGEELHESEAWFDPRQLPGCQEGSVPRCRRALDQNRINQGFYPGSKARAKAMTRTSLSRRPSSKAAA